MKDTRKKGCPNENCVINQKEEKLRNDIDYCPKCGTKLVYVCANKGCYNKLTGTKFKDRVCEECSEKAENKKAYQREKAKELAGSAVVFAKEHGAEAVAQAVGPKAVEIAKKGKPVIEKAVRIVIKRK